MAESSKRYRNFASIVFPDSRNTPDDWIECLKRERVPMFISPQHTDGYCPEAPEQGNKPHYHVMVMFEGKKTEEQAREFFSVAGGVGLEVIGSKVGYARYLCHLDEDDKQHYDPSDVLQYGGVDYSSIIECSSDFALSITEMEAFCEQYNVHSFYLLCRYASIHRPDWSRILRNSATLYMREFIKSRSWSHEKGYISIIDENGVDLITGVVINDVSE